MKWKTLVDDGDLNFSTKLTENPYIMCAEMKTSPGWNLRRYLSGYAHPNPMSHCPLCHLDHPVGS